MQCDSEEQLISKLEGVFYRRIYNNSQPIRYPITFRDGSKLKGKNTILDPLNMDTTKFYSGHYKFGANSVYIYEALKDILDKLEEFGLIEDDWREESYWIIQEDEA